MPSGGSLDVSRSSPSAPSSSGVRRVRRRQSSRPRVRARVARGPACTRAEREPTASRTSRTSSSNASVSGPAASRTTSDVPAPACDAELGEVLRGDGLHAARRLRQDEERQAPEQPRHVVDQHLPVPEDEGRADDRVREPGAGEGVLDGRLAPEVRIRRVGGGMRDAQLDDAPDPGRSGGLEQPDRGPHRRRECRLLVGKADPVGVVERVDPPQARAGVGEVERERLDAVAERALGERPPRQRPHLAAALEQTARRRISQ